MNTDLVMAFSSDYVTARRRFREAVEGIGWTWQPYSISETGPRGEDLTIDVATSLPPSSHPTLVISSGLHGVEGFFGSAVQLALLERWKQNPASAAGIRVVFLHAMNPYGFAWFRRFDADNIDLNRNFLLKGMEYEGSSDRYAEFDCLLNPRRPSSRWDPFRLKALWLVARYGKPALKQALVTGQYVFPKGLFFGGKGPSRTQMILQKHMKSWIGDATSVVHLDFHTGLGSWGTCKLLIDYHVPPAQADRLTRWFGAEAWEENDPQRVAFRAMGSLGHWCTAQNFAAEYLFSFVEVGTYGGVRMIAGLRAENQCHHWGNPTDTSTRRVKERLKELFCPDSTAWRRRVLEHGVRFAEKAAIGMKADAGIPGNVG